MYLKEGNRRKETKCFPVWGKQSPDPPPDVFTSPLTTPSPAGTAARMRGIRAKPPSPLFAVLFRCDELSRRPPAQLSCSCRSSGCKQLSLFIPPPPKYSAASALSQQAVCILTATWQILKAALRRVNEPNCLFQETPAWGGQPIGAVGC